MTPIILCADDYGLAPGVDRGILELLEEGRLSAVTCLVGYPEWPQAARRLLPFRGSVDIGLHFSLTTTWPSYPLLLARLATGRPPRVEEALKRQYGLFCEHLGEPDFVDGHQNVHQLPWIDRAVLDFCSSRPVWVRNSAMLHPGRSLKRWGHHLPGLLFRRRLRHLGLPTNDWIVGGDLYAGPVHWRLEGIRGLTVWVVHPGYVDSVLSGRDGYCAGRAAELDALKKFDLSGFRLRAFAG